MKKFLALITFIFAIGYSEGVCSAITPEAYETIQKIAQTLTEVEQNTCKGCESLEKAEFPLCVKIKEGSFIRFGELKAAIFSLYNHWR
jgi:hypothetical protein